MLHLYYRYYGPEENGLGVAGPVNFLSYTGRRANMPS